MSTLAARHLRMKLARLNHETELLEQSKLTETGISIESQNKLSKYMLGELGELTVAADLLSRGYHAFKSVTHSCPCDLVVLIHGVLLKVEVKTYNDSDRTKCPRPKNEFDIVAAVSYTDDEILYSPDLVIVEEILNNGI
jgi:hypothetical protein